MNLNDLLQEEKPVQTKKLFAPSSEVTVIKLKAQSLLKEHVTKVPALLVCVIGKAVFENEMKHKEILESGSFINIEPNIKHQISAEKDSVLLLIK